MPGEIFSKKKMSYFKFLRTVWMVFLWALYFTMEAQAPVKCFTGEHVKLLQNRPLKIGQAENKSMDELHTRSVVNIPVVVHVVWNTPEENISDEQILSQIEVLNQDFRAENIEIPGIPSLFKNKIADVEFEFCLATRDPQGQATSGITRTFTNNSVGIGGTKAVHYAAQGGSDAWDPQHYLNIWVAKFFGGIGGTGSFPGEAPLPEDGIEINYKQFGKLNLQPPYHLGRTCTHEVGHYFNLEHVWGPNLNSCCNEDDFVDDTPNSCETYLHQCPVHPVFSCSEQDMFMNFMFLTDDACMGMFTLGQKARMWEALNLYRPGLLDSEGCGMVPAVEKEEQVRIVVYGNPAGEQLQFEIKFPGSTSWQVKLFNLIGQQVLLSQVNSNEIHKLEVSSLHPGLYWLEVQKGSERRVMKVVIQ
jgi:hypothetical protein